MGQLAQSQANLSKHQENLANETRQSIKNFENQVGQLAKQLSERPPGMFPSDTIVNPKENCSAITLRSGNTLLEPEEKKVEKNKKKEADVGESEKLGESKVREVESTNNTISPKVSGGSKVPFPKALEKELRKA